MAFAAVCFLELINYFDLCQTPQTDQTASGEISSVYQTQITSLLTLEEQQELS